MLPRTHKSEANGDSKVRRRDEKFRNEAWNLNLKISKFVSLQEKNTKKKSLHIFNPLLFPPFLLLYLAAFLSSKRIEALECIIYHRLHSESRKIPRSTIQYNRKGQSRCGMRNRELLSTMTRRRILCPARQWGRRCISKRHLALNLIIVNSIILSYSHGGQIIQFAARKGRNGEGRRMVPVDAATGPRYAERPDYLSRVGCWDLWIPRIFTEFRDDDDAVAPGDVGAFADRRNPRIPRRPRPSEAKVGKCHLSRRPNLLRMRVRYEWRRIKEKKERKKQKER